MAALSILRPEACRRRWLLFALVVFAFALRFFTSRWLPWQADEPNSLLGAYAAANKGVPILPSGAAYLHGATLSWLTAPLVWFGIANIDHLRELRVLSAVAGACTVW